MEKERVITTHTDKAGAENLEDAFVSLNAKDTAEIEVVDAQEVEMTPEQIIMEKVTEMESVMNNMPTNTPYVKELDEEGNILNPVVKGRPYLHPYRNRREMRALVEKATKHPKNNKKGIRLIVTKVDHTKFSKTEVIKQIVSKGIERDTFELDGTLIKRGTKVQKTRVLIHNRPQK